MKSFILLAGTLNETPTLLTMWEFASNWSQGLFPGVGTLEAGDSENPNVYVGPADVADRRRADKFLGHRVDRGEWCEDFSKVPKLVHFGSFLG